VDRCVVLMESLATLQLQWLSLQWLVDSCAEPMNHHVVNLSPCLQGLSLIASWDTWVLLSQPAQVCKICVLCWFSCVILSACAGTDRQPCTALASVPADMPA
jgi:hypothetical protein